MENFKANIKNLSKNKIYLILIGLAVIILATVLIYAYVEFLSDKISVVPTEEGKPYCGAIGSRSEGWYSNIDGLIKWDNCDGCYAVCMYVGTRSEGWYVSGNCDSGLNLIKYDNCGEKSCYSDSDCYGITIPIGKEVYTVETTFDVVPMMQKSLIDGHHAQVEKISNSELRITVEGKEIEFIKQYEWVKKITKRSSQFCEFPEGECKGPGKCVNKLINGGCAAVWTPICGCDGKTYSNDCFRNMAGVSKKHDGECKQEDCAKEGEKVNRNPLMGSTDKQCCEGLVENRVSRSYSICEKLIEECVKEGEKNYFGKPACCEGLTQITNSYLPNCMITKDGSGYCTKCGDGICKSPENICNCPEDCKEETGSITITSPNGGEKWMKGNAYNITWAIEPTKTSINYPKDAVEIYLVEGPDESCTGLEKHGCQSVCANWKLIASGIPTSFGKYGWKIPVDQKTESNYKIFVRTKSNSFTGCVDDKSDNYFSIIDEGSGECTDTDHGRDYYKKGSISKCYDGTCTIPMQDFCILFDMAPNSTYSGKAINEYYCDGNQIKSEKFECPNGCENGACVVGDEPYCSLIGSYSEGWYSSKDGRITWENCDGCHAVCKAIGSKSEGWYSSGNCETAGKLIKYDNCAEEVSCRDENYECTVKDIPCCSGLKSSALFADPNGDCSEMANCGTICIPCGNGICDKNEGRCNCPEDCKESETLSADLNCDGKVNLTDSAILLSFWGKDPSGATSCKSPDINQDGNVNLTDFSIIMSQWTTLL